MLIGSFYTGLSGLQANATTLNVTGNNLSNVNTSGFKRGQANFAQVMSNTVSGLAGNNNPIQMGLGVRTSEVLQTFRQGSIQTTGQKTQLAIQGDGFFTVRQNGSDMYTRSGNFSFNNEGFLVAGNGGRVQGYTNINDRGEVDAAAGLDDVRVDLGSTSDPVATTLARFTSNFNAGAAEGETFNGSMEVFDSKGVAHTLTATFTKSANTGEWTYTFDVTGGEFDPPPAAEGEAAPFPASGSLIFDQEGKMEAIGPTGGPFVLLTDAGSADLDLSITNLSSGAADMTVTWDVENEDAGGGASYLQEHGTVNTVASLFQNGSGAGSLQDIEIAQDGRVLGFYSNGTTLPIARIALATFANNQGLKQLDGNFYIPTNASGVANFNGNEEDALSSIISGSLENSNVDIAEEFTTMITGQRGYQSNSRTITTIDQLMQEALNIKR